MKLKCKKANWQIIIAACLFVAFFNPVTLTAQTDTTKTDTLKTNEVVAEEDSSLISPSLEFFSVQKGNNTIDLKTALKAKIKGTFYQLPKLKITFYQIMGDAEKELGFLITDKNGKAVFTVNADSVKTDNEGKLHFKAVYAGNKQIDPAEEEVNIKRARLEITPVKEDSLLNVQVKLIDLGNGTEKPVPETVLGVFVNRMFNPLKVGEGTTDENGEAAVEIPVNLPGDAKGNITLMAKLEENETYGNLEASVIQKWGVPVSDKLEDQPRALWSSHPPLWMLITFILLMVVVWGHYIVIVYEMLRLRKEEPLSIPGTTNS